MTQPIKGGNFPGNVPSLPQNYGAEPPPPLPKAFAFIEPE